MLIAHFSTFVSVGVLCLFDAAALSARQSDSQADQDPQTVEISLAQGALTMNAPKAWTKIDPRFGMIEAEFSVEKVGDDENNARLTIMSSGGSVKQNIDRWIGQFSQPDGSSSEDKTKVEEIEIDGMRCHIVDITGTFADRPGGPVSPPTMRDNYRMLGAIIETDAGGNYYVKFYGGKETIDKNQKLFMDFVKSLKADQD